MLIASMKCGHLIIDKCFHLMHSIGRPFLSFIKVIKKNWNQERSLTHVMSLKGCHCLVVWCLGLIKHCVCSFSPSTLCFKLSSPKEKK